MRWGGPAAIENYRAALSSEREAIIADPRLSKYNFKEKKNCHGSQIAA
jgi:hypothetical protein